MANKRNKDATKRREARRREKAVSRRAQVRNRRLGAVPRADYASPFSDEPFPEKLSATIWSYATPLLDQAQGSEQQRNAVNMALFCWNASLFPIDEAREQMRPALDELSGGDKRMRRDLFAIFEMMYARKQAHFSGDRRLVVDFHLADTREGLHLQVMSTPLRKAPVRIGAGEAA